jgi:hypothetical protein
VSCVPNVASFSVPSILFIAPSVFSNVYLLPPQSSCARKGYSVPSSYKTDYKVHFCIRKWYAIVYPFLIIVFIILYKLWSVRLYLRLFVGGFMSYLRYLCLVCIQRLCSCFSYLRLVSCVCRQFKVSVIIIVDILRSV